MLDRYPTQQEINAAQTNYDFGIATGNDMNILAVAYPWRDYGPIGEPDYWSVVFGFTRY